MAAETPITRPTRSRTMTANRCARTAGPSENPGIAKYGFPYRWPAEHEGGPENGVLTAVEDFAANRRGRSARDPADVLRHRGPVALAAPTRTPSPPSSSPGTETPSYAPRAQPRLPPDAEFALVSQLIRQERVLKAAPNPARSASRAASRASATAARPMTWTEHFAIPLDAGDNGDLSHVTLGSARGIQSPRARRRRRDFRRRPAGEA